MFVYARACLSHSPCEGQTWSIEIINVSWVLPHVCVLVQFVGSWGAEATGSRTYCHLLNLSSIISLFLSLSFSLPSPCFPLSYSPVRIASLPSSSSSFSPLFYLWLCTERWTPAVWRHHKVTRNLDTKSIRASWCKPRAPLSLRSTSAVCSHSVYTAQLHGNIRLEYTIHRLWCAKLHSIIVWVVFSSFYRVLLWMSVHLCYPWGHAIVLLHK